MSSEAPELDRLEGWKEIAAALKISVRAAQERAGRSYDPLPMRKGHRGPWAYASALRDWVMRQDVAYSVALQQHRATTADAAGGSRRR